MSAKRRLICPKCDFITESQELADNHMEDNRDHGAMFWKDIQE